MATASGSLAITAARLLDDHRMQKFSINDIGWFLTEGARICQSRFKAGTTRRSFSLVANQSEYALSAKVAECVDLIWRPAAQHQRLTAEMRESFNSRKKLYGAVPQVYSYLDNESKVMLWPTPSAADASSTLNGSVTASSTTFTLTDASGFASEGRALVESEVIQWTGTTSTTLTGVTRGLEDTVAASHNSAVTITERGVMIDAISRIGSRAMNVFYFTGTATTTNGSAAVTGTTTAWANGNTHGGAGTGDMFGVTSDTSSFVDPSVWYEITTVTSDTAITLTNVYAEPSVSGSKYIISSPSPMPDQFDKLMLLYTMKELTKREGDIQRAGFYQKDYDEAWKEALVRDPKANLMQYPRGRFDRQYNPRRRPYIGQAGANYPLP